MESYVVKIGLLFVRFAYGFLTWACLLTLMGNWVGLWDFNNAKLPATTEMALMALTLALWGIWRHERLEIRIEQLERELNERKSPIRLVVNADGTSRWRV